MTKPAIISWQATPISDSTMVGGVSVGGGSGDAGEVPISNGDGTATFTDLEAAVAALGRFLETVGGGKGKVAPLGTLGSGPLTIDVGLGNWLWGTLDDDIDLDFSGLTDPKGCDWLLELIEDGTGGHTPNLIGVTWLTADGSPPIWNTTAGTTTFIGLLSRNGGTTIYAGILGGGGSGATASDTAVWMPLTTVVAGEPVLVWDGDDSLIPTLVPLA